MKEKDGLTAKKVLLENGKIKEYLDGKEYFTSEVNSEWIIVGNEVHDKSFAVKDKDFSFTFIFRF